MSFVIAISDGEKIVMAADSQVTYSDGDADHRYQKIHKLNSSDSDIYIGCAGETKLIDRAVHMAQMMSSNYGDKRHPSDYLNIINKTIDDELMLIPKHLRKPKVAFLLISNYRNDSPTIYYYNALRDKKNTIKVISSTPVYVYLKSSHLSSSMADNLIEECLADRKYSTLEEKAKAIVYKVAYNDPTVDHFVSTVSL